MRRTLAPVALAAVLACGGDGAGTTTTEVESTSTTEAPTTTTTLATTTTTEPPTTTAAPTTTIALTPELTAALFASTFEATRQTILDVWEDDINVETVDGFVVEVTDPEDVTSLVVKLDVTSGWASEDNQHDGAWEITRAMAVLWHPTEGAYYNELWSPAFQLTNSGRVYACPADLMTRLADARASRTEWEETCAS